MRGGSSQWLSSAFALAHIEVMLPRGRTTLGWSIVGVVDDACKCKLVECVEISHIILT